MGDQRVAIGPDFKAPVFLNAGFDVVSRKGRGAEQNFELSSAGRDLDVANVMLGRALQGVKDATIPEAHAVMTAERGINVRHVPVDVWVEIRQERINRIKPVKPCKPIGDETAYFGVVCHFFTSL